MASPSSAGALDLTLEPDPRSRLCSKTHRGIIPLLASSGPEWQPEPGAGGLKSRPSHLPPDPSRGAQTLFHKHKR